MAHFHHEAIDSLARLGLKSPDRAIMAHATAIAVRGYDLGRPLGDIDVVTDQENLEDLARRFGWVATRQMEYDDGDMPESIHRLVSPDGQFDFYSCDFIRKLYEKTGRGRLYTDHLLTLLDPRYDQDEDTGILAETLELVYVAKERTERPMDADLRRRIAQIHTFGY